MTRMVSATGPINLEFALGNDPSAKGVVRFLLLTAPVGPAIVLALFARNVVPEETAFGGSILLFVMQVAFALNLWLMQLGVAKLTDSRLVIRTRAGRHLYKWTDVADMRLKKLADLHATTRIWAAISGSDKERPFVEIKLRRSLRVGLLPGQFGTEIIGFPSFLFKTARLYLADPEAFIQAANPYLQR